MTTIVPFGSNFKYSAIYCSSCGAIVGVQEFYNLGSSLIEKPNELPERIKRIESALLDILSTLDRIAMLLNNK